MNRKLVTACSIITLTACSPYMYGGGGEVVPIEIEGDYFVVQKSLEHPGRWGARPDETKEFWMNLHTRQLKGIEAIEIVSGCKVLPSTILNDSSSYAVFAVVDCD
jgi:hypothetical protein